MLVLALATAGSSLLRFTLGSPSALSAAARFVPADDVGSTPWYAASSPGGFAFLRACGLALAVEADGCEVVESTDVPGGAILCSMSGDDTGQSNIFGQGTIVHSPQQVENAVVVVVV